MEKLYSVKQVANILNIHYVTARELVSEGRIKGSKIGRIWRIRESEVSEYLTRNLLHYKKDRSSGWDELKNISSEIASKIPENVNLIEILSSSRR
jgi:excisionase family DNA binding protein